jgi:hypothetical protein
MEDKTEKVIQKRVKTSLLCLRRRVKLCRSEASYVGIKEGFSLGMNQNFCQHINLAGSMACQNMPVLYILSPSNFEDFLVLPKVVPTDRIMKLELAFLNKKIISVSLQV